MSGGYFGRRAIKTDAEEITEDNVLKILSDALVIHRQNRLEMEYLYNYYRGNQPVLERTKEIRPEICNRIVENRAHEIVSFQTGYIMGEPVQYISLSTENESPPEGINILNRYMAACDKAAGDMELAEWAHICGTAYRMILPSQRKDQGEAPFDIYTLNPLDSFVVYYSGLGERPMMGVKYVTRADKSVLYSVYTENKYFLIADRSAVPGTNDPGKYEIQKNENHIYGGIPIIEYPLNKDRLGAFEIVLPLLDAINSAESDRLDAVDQFIEALMVLIGADIEDEEFIHLKELGGIKLPAGGDIKYLIQEMNQTQTQVLIDHLYQSVLTICGMPNRNGGSSTSDTGSAVIMRDGWSDAEARAKNTELMFKKSEKAFLRIALNIMDVLRGITLSPSDVEARFTRRNYENIQVKSQVLTTLLDSEKIDPRLAFIHCGLFVDPELAYKQSEEYAKKRRAEQLSELEAIASKATDQQQDEAEEEMTNV